MSKSNKHINRIAGLISTHVELLFWASAVLLLFFMDSTGPSLCVFRWIGFASCPGCGLGHSIHAALHLEFAESFKEHPFGIVAVFIILHRVKQLFPSFKNKLLYDK